MRREAVSIHAFRGEGDRTVEISSSFDRVSIHAFRGEGDDAIVPFQPLTYVSIHAFRGEGDDFVSQTVLCTRAFQSTPSGGKATCAR